MATWIGLFRGINVGGHHVLPMAKLKADFESLKFKNVRTYIQSGNVVFESSAVNAATMTKTIIHLIETRHRFRPQLLVIKPDHLQSVIESNPFAQAVADPKTLHFFFLAEPATEPDLAAINSAKSLTEKSKLTDRALYLHAPDGIGRSKFAANVEKFLGVVATARNYRTVEKIRGMATPTDS